MTSLENVAAQFKKWRGSRRHCRFPKYFWDQLQQLSSQYNPSTLAQTFGISLHYLRRKLQMHQSLKFAEVRISPLTTMDVAIEFPTPQGNGIVVHFQANQDDVIRMVAALSGQKS